MELLPLETEDDIAMGLGTKWDEEPEGETGVAEIEPELVRKLLFLSKTWKYLGSIKRPTEPSTSISVAVLVVDLDVRPLLVPFDVFVGSLAGSVLARDVLLLNIKTQR